VRASNYVFLWGAPLTAQEKIMKLLATNTVHGQVWEVVLPANEQGESTIYIIREDGTGYGQDIWRGGRSDIYDLPPRFVGWVPGDGLENI
jgi:hypothetical protein